MESNLIKFGDVFSYQGRQYVFLAKIQEILYLGQIISINDTNRILDLLKIRELQGKKGMDIASQNTLFCFVILTTKDFDGRMANFKDTSGGKSSIDNNSNQFFDSIDCSLDKKDLIEIKKEILEGAMPKLLKEIVEQIDIS